MSRRKPGNFRQPGPTETELALQWELARLRKETALLRQTPPEQRGRPWSYLDGPQRKDLSIKIGRIWRNGVARYVSKEDRCPHCGGMTEEQVEQAWHDHGAHERQVQDAYEARVTDYQSSKTRSS